MVVVFNGHEPKGLQHALGRLPWAKDLGHGVHRSGLRLKCNFDEVALSQRVGQIEQSAGHGNGLELCFGAAAVFESNRSQDGISKLDPGRAPRRVRLGEVGHKLSTPSHYALLSNRLLRPIVRIPLCGRQVEVSRWCRLNDMRGMYQLITVRKDSRGEFPVCAWAQKPGNVPSV